MTQPLKPLIANRVSRLKIITGAIAALATTNRVLGGQIALADTAPEQGEDHMTPKAVVYTEAASRGLHSSCYT